MIYYKIYVSKEIWHIVLCEIGRNKRKCKKVMFKVSLHCPRPFLPDFGLYVSKITRLYIQVGLSVNYEKGAWYRCVVCTVVFSRWHHTLKLFIYTDISKNRVHHQRQISDATFHLPFMAPQTMYHCCHNVLCFNLAAVGLFWNDHSRCCLT